MFQSWFVELISVSSDIIVGLSAILLSVAALSGLTQWRSELKGKARLDMARRLAILGYQFRDQYLSARGMFTFSQEFTEREQLPDENADEARYRNEYFARIKRLRLLQETMRELYQATWEGEVVFDIDVESLIKPLAKSFNDLYVALDTYFGHHIERVRIGAPPDSPDAAWLREYHKTIYGHAEDENARFVIEGVTHLVQAIRGLL
jgi:hypothetical protein